MVGPVAIPDLDAPLHFHKRPDADVVADGAAIQIHEGAHADVATELHVRRDEAEMCFLKTHAAMRLGLTDGVRATARADSTATEPPCCFKE